MTIKTFLNILRVIKTFFEMCGPKHNQPKATNAEENVNLGILNISSNNQGVVSVETVLEILSFCILALLLIRWLKKCLKRRKEESEQRLASIVRPEGRPSRMEIPSAPRALMAPAGMEHMEMQMQPPQPVGPIGMSKYT